MVNWPARGTTPWDTPLKAYLDGSFASKTATETALGAVIGVADSDLFVPAGGDIQAAIDEAGGARRVVLAPGTFTVTTPLLYRSTHSNLHIEALVPGTTTLVIDDSATAYATVSDSILRNEIGTKAYEETGRSDTLPAGSTSVSVTDASDIEAGDLLFLVRETVAAGSRGELRRVIRVDGTTVYFDIPLYRGALDGATWTLYTYRPRSAVVRGLTFDTANHDAGHAGITFDRLCDVLIEDCRFVTGGQHGAYCYSSYNVTYRRCHAEGFDKMTNAWTPERTGESLISASRSNLAGQGYGVAFEAVYGLAEDCTFRRNRHHIAAGGGLVNSAHLVYRNCHGTEDLQGAYDLHENTDFCVIEPTCSAARGWAGLWLRGRGITAGGTYTDMEAEGARLHEYPADIRVSHTSLRCGRHVRMIGLLADTAGITIGGRAERCAGDIAVHLSNTGKRVADVTIADLEIVGDDWQVRLEGRYTNLVIRDVRWKGPHNRGSVGSGTAPVWIRADDVARAVDGAQLRRLRVDTGGDDIGSTVLLERSASASALADGTYANVVVDDVTLDTDGGSSFGGATYVAIGNNGSASPSAVTGRFARQNLWRNDAEVTP